MGQVRGKAWIWSGSFQLFKSETLLMAGEAGPGVPTYIDPTTQNPVERPYYIQNKYQLTTSYSLSDKVKDVEDTAFNQEMGPSKLKINFLSASGAGFNIL